MRTLSAPAYLVDDVDTLSQPEAKRRYLAAKRVFDVLFCLLILVPVAVIALICAVAVRLESPGPIVYSQFRIGKDGRPFRMYKFRTMVENAEELKASLAHLNVLPPPDFKIPDDPRVTRVGKVLRKTSLDELPQFVNVLKGDMSIVGPRPAEDGMDTYRLWYGERLEVPPGITGIWQLEGRAAISFDERLRYDLEYIRTMSLWVDIKLIVRTIAVVFKGTGV
jgi:lipopolysaccharide/colanic/teichoic acid biosynthesis glycosyltransferase